MVSQSYKIVLEQLQKCEDELAEKLPPKNSRLRKWLEERYTKYAFSSLQLALQIPETVAAWCEILRLRKSGKFSFRCTKHDLAIWHSYWRDGKKMWAALVSRFAQDFSTCDEEKQFDGIQFLKESERYFLDFSKLSKRQKIMEIDNNIEVWDFAYKVMRLELRAALASAYQFAKGNDSDCDVEIDPSRHLALFFLVDIWLPCIDKYHVNSDALLLEAIKGNVEAIEKVLMLDSSMREMPEISQVMQKFCMAGQFDELNLLISATNSEVWINDRIAHVKAFYSSWVIEHSRTAGQINQKLKKKLSPEDLRKLFDAHVQDSGLTLTDETLPYESAWKEQIRICRKNCLKELLQFY